MNYYLAIDIGASSGRHIVGWLEAGEIKTDEVYRFPNGAKELNGRLVWEIDKLFEEVKNGIRVALKKYPSIKTLAIDTWGCDYVLLANGGEIKPFYSYRDNRTEKVVDGVHRHISFNELYERTGIQYQPFNTIYQLYEDKLAKRLDMAEDFLMIPEYLNYKLTGVRMHEYTNATTTGLVNTKTKEYDLEITEKLGLPARLFGKLYQAGTPVGALKSEIAKEVGGQTEVVLCASHDTASAVEGMNVDGDSAYISSGTWSLLGLKAESAITDENSRRANWSNEGGVGYIRYQKNIMGMWVVNRLKSELCPEKPFAQIVAEAERSTFGQYVDVNDGAFLAPESMKGAFDSKLEIKPKQECDYFRCAFLSLAMCYKQSIAELRANTGKSISELYIVGGGAKNGLLNGLTEQACKLKVKAIPVEATAIGNLKIQIGRQ